VLRALGVLCVCRISGDGRYGWDKYGGRIDGAITMADGHDFGHVMLETGHAKPYDGQGPKPTYSALPRAPQEAAGSSYGQLPSGSHNQVAVQQYRATSR
jgi:endonuclease YncB( thermonuclease family)